MVHDITLCVHILNHLNSFFPIIFPLFFPSPLQEKVPLSWVNQPLFDYRNQLRSGTVTLPCWPVSPEEPLEDLLNPIGQCQCQCYSVKNLHAHLEFSLC